MLKPREGKPQQSADLLVCFPSRSHLALMPKPICSPARPSDHNKRRHHRRNRSISMLAGGGGGQGSPSVDIAEPTSPKVTCAGQIKVRPKNTSTTACRSWQSVMEEIEKIHNGKKQRRNNNKRMNWIESLGFKKEVMQFLTCLRSIRFDFRCFGSFPGTDIVTSDDEEEEDEDEEAEDNSERRKESGDNQEEEEEEGSRTVFSKWYMVLQEDQSSSSNNNNAGVDEEKEKVMARDDEDDESVTVAVPPRNALLLMRCRSAPAKSWLKREIEEEVEEEEEGGEGGKGKEKAEIVRGKSLKSLMEEERRIIKNTEDNNKKKKLLVMRYEEGGDLYDIAKETWIVGGLRETFSKTRSCKR